MVEVQIIASALVVGAVVCVLLIIIMDTYGPYDILLKLQSWAMEQRMSDGVVRTVHPFFNGLYSCKWCMSFWLALIVTAGYTLLMRKPWAMFPFIWFISMWWAVLLKNAIDWFQSIDL